MDHPALHADPRHRFEYLLWELDLVTRSACSGEATENDIRGTEDAIDAVLAEMGMSMGQAMRAYHELHVDQLTPPT